MKATYKIDAPDEMDATLTVTMPLGAWRELMRQQASAWPAWKFGSAIADMIAKADKTFRTTGEVTP